MTYALIIGESLIDVVHGADGSIREHPGGSPANVALGLARLGREAHLATWFATDEHGEAIRAHLSADGVRIVRGSDGAERTSTAIATLAADGSAEYVFDLDWRLPELHLDSEVGVVHVGSIGATLPPGAAAVAEIAHAAREYSTITYDPNVRPTIMGTPLEAEPLIERVAAAADVIKVSDEDLRWLYPTLEPADAARQWSTQGPALVVVTRGADGALAFTSSGAQVQMPSVTVTVADTVGAGDSYMAALIHGLWSHDLIGAERREALHAVDAATLGDIMAQAATAAAITVGRPGADPPRLEELERADQGTASDLDRTGSSNGPSGAGAAGGPGNPGGTE